MAISVSTKAKPKRIDHLLSTLGYCSRRDASRLCKEERITVNGIIIKDASYRADPHTVLLDNAPLDHPDSILIMMNKPVNYVCSHDASEGALIYDLLPVQWMNRKPQPISIGRLDKDTSGLILITDITPLVHYFTSPKQCIDKVYNVEVDNPLSSKLPHLFATGTIMIDEDAKPCLPAKYMQTGEKTCTLILTEGRYRQVRRMFGSLGYTVVKLHRSAFGPYSIGNVQEGSYVEVQVLTA
jgi:16S rRNA pseudouridine516 synthase